MENENRPHFKAGAIKYTKGYGMKLFVSKLIKFMLIMIVLISVLGSIYIFVKQPVRTKDGYVFATPVHSLMNPGQNIILVEDGKYNLFTPLKRALFENEIHEAKIIAGPYGKLEGSEGNIEVTDGSNIISVNLENIDDGFLDEEYIVRKVNSGQDLLVNKNHILGLKIAN